LKLKTARVRSTVPHAKFLKLLGQLMKKVQRITVLALAVLSLSAQSPISEPRQEYEEYLRALRASVLSGNAEALGALVTEDRVSVSGATGRTMRGRVAQVEADRALFRGSQITSFEMQLTDFRSSGSLAYATGVGTHTVVDRSTGQQRTDSFQYVEVLILGSDGLWRSQFFMNAPQEPR
jgi:hypothetical protein